MCCEPLSSTSDFINLDYFFPSKLICMLLSIYLFESQNRYFPHNIYNFLRLIASEFDSIIS